ncbi:MAG: hypothetical protein NE328_17960 [Lentisphaeraceae bacterium]|nr:hypothetical protein [Lentisphaeraceae bacterium]
MTLKDPYEIRDAIGDFAEGEEILPSTIQLVERATEGSIETSMGKRYFAIDLDSILLENIDLSETIWPEENFPEISQNVPLTVLKNQSLWEKVKDYWAKENPKGLEAFIKKIAVPLKEKLSIKSNWIKL